MRDNKYRNIHGLWQLGPFSEIPPSIITKQIRLRRIIPTTRNRGKSPINWIFRILPKTRKHFRIIIPKPCFNFFLLLLLPLFPSFCKSGWRCKSATDLYKYSHLSRSRIIVANGLPPPFTLSFTQPSPSSIVTGFWLTIIRKSCDASPTSLLFPFQTPPFFFFYFFC